MKLGAFNINYLNGGITQMDGGAIFGVVPKPLWTKRYAVNEKNQVPNLTYPILIQTGDKNILIDAGIGNHKLTDKQLKNYGVTYESQIHDELEKLNLNVEDIDMVLMSHMHFDRTTGLTDVDGNSIFRMLLILCNKTSGMNLQVLTSVVRQLIGKSIEVLMKIN